MESASLVLESNPWDWNSTFKPDDDDDPEDFTYNSYSTIGENNFTYEDIYSENSTGISFSTFNTLDLENFTTTENSTFQQFLDYVYSTSSTLNPENLSTEEDISDFKDQFQKLFQSVYSDGNAEDPNTTEFILNVSGKFEQTSQTITSSSTSIEMSSPQDFTPSTNAIIVTSTTEESPIIPRINISTSCICKRASIEDYMSTLDYKNQSKLRSLCWETMFGQELVKLTVMDLFMTIMSTLAMDFFRGVFVRVMNNCWCWDLEKIFPQYGDFKVAENILHLVNNQGMVWMGMFFSPGIITLNVVKLYVMVYFRSWIVLTCNVPHKVVFRASRSNNFYYALLLSMLFLCVIPVGYAIVWVRPSKHCGPFSHYEKIFQIFTKTLREIMPSSVHQILDYIASPGVVIPLLVLMILIIYYLVSLTDALREANNDLKVFF